jgi:hypothetical protein
VANLEDLYLNFLLKMISPTTSLKYCTRSLNHPVYYGFLDTAAVKRKYALRVARLNGGSVRAFLLSPRR